MTKKIPVVKGGRHTSKYMWTDALTSYQSYEVIKERSDWSNNTRRDLAALKEATVARHAAKVEGGLALFEDSKLGLEDISSLAGVVKLKVDYM